jgi:hypothetical protein
VKKAKTGIRSMNADLILPFKSGINKAPMTNMAAGGRLFIIIVLFSPNYLS